MSMDVSMQRELCHICGADGGDSYFARSLCPDPRGSMHQRCASCGAAFDDCRFEVE